MKELAHYPVFPVFFPLSLPCNFIKAFPWYPRVTYKIHKLKKTNQSVCASPYWCFNFTTGDKKQLLKLEAHYLDTVFKLAN